MPLLVPVPWILYLTQILMCLILIDIGGVLLLGFDTNEVRFIDKIRYFRNGMLYYGTKLDSVYANKVIEFTEAKYIKLKELVQNY